MFFSNAALFFTLLQGAFSYVWPADNYSKSPQTYGIGALDDMVDWSRHPCKRECKDNDAKTCRYGFTIENYAMMSKACFNCPRNVTDCFRPHCLPGDGNDSRMVLVVNRQLPGTSIEVCKGDRIIVDVKNKLNAESTSVHWHGLHQRGTPFMDGVPMISQCPIAADDSFRYDFKADRAGTFWWHSHTGLQRGDGLFGTVIVRPLPSENRLGSLYERDEHVITLNEWSPYLGSDSYTLLYQTTVNVITPHSIFINGLGHSQSSDKSAPIPRPVFRVKQGEKHRFRLINAGSFHCSFSVTVDQHPLVVVSADGADVQPIEVDAVRSLTGERYDFIVDANREIGNYWIRVTGSDNCATKRLHQEAILRYEGAAEKEPSKATGFDVGFGPGLKVLNPSSLSSSSLAAAVLCVSCALTSLEADDLSLKATPDHQFYLTLGYYVLAAPEFARKNLYDLNEVPITGFMAQINHLTFKAPSAPLQTQPELIGSDYLCNVTEAKCTREQCSCPNVLQVELNSTVELIFVDQNSTPQKVSHPMHLHGFYYRVVAMGQLTNKMNTVEDVRAWDRAGRIHRKLKGAPWKDVLDVPSAGYAVVRIRADNPGFWYMHCHFERHAHNGMAMVMKVGDYKDFPAVPKDFPKCHFHA